MPRLAHLSGNSVERLGVLRRLASQRQRFSRTWRPSLRATMHVEVAFDLAPFLREQHRQEKARTKDLAEAGEQSRARAGTEGAGLSAVLAQQPRPDVDV